MEKSTDWIPLLDYALKKGLSVSTLRRYIKSNKVKHQLEKGRYYIYDGAEDPHPRTGLASGSGPISDGAVREIEALRGQCDTLNRELSRANEQVAELTMLVKLYEEKLFAR